MRDFTQLFKIFWQTYGVFVTLILGSMFLFLLKMSEGTPSMLSIFREKLCSENFFGIAMWLVMIMAIEPIITPNEHHQSWQLQKILWTGALLLFYFCVFISGYVPSDLMFLAPFMVYLVRLFIPYQWVKKWTLLFIGFDEQKC